MRYIALAILLTSCGQPTVETRYVQVEKTSDAQIATEAKKPIGEKKEIVEALPAQDVLPVDKKPNLPLVIKDEPAVKFNPQDPYVARCVSKATYALESGVSVRYEVRAVKLTEGHTMLAIIAEAENMAYGFGVDHIEGSPESQTAIVRNGIKGVVYEPVYHGKWIVLAHKFPGEPMSIAVGYDGTLPGPNACL